MTGIQRPWLWSLPTRVELAEGAVIRFEDHGRAGLTLEQRQIDKMFEVGLTQPPLTNERRLDATVGVVLNGDARFLVGQVDLGRQVGLEVLRRGLDAAIDASSQEQRDRYPQPPSDPSTTERERQHFREEDARLRVMTIGEAAGRWHELLPKIALWDRVVLTEDGRRVALIVAWDWWTLHRHRQASLEGAYWASWHTGCFNFEGYASDLMRLLEPRDARVNHAHDQTDDGDDGGDGLDEQLD